MTPFLRRLLLKSEAVAVGNRSAHTHSRSLARSLARKSRLSRMIAHRLEEVYRAHLLSQRREPFTGARYFVSPVVSVMCGGLRRNTHWSQLAQRILTDELREGSAPSRSGEGDERKTDRCRRKDKLTKSHLPPTVAVVRELYG